MRWRDRMWSDPIPRVTAAIAQHPLCIQCIATNAFTHEVDAEAALSIIARVVQIRLHENARCHGCGEVGRVFWIEGRRGRAA